MNDARAYLDRWLLAVLLALAAMWLPPATPLFAHEIGTTKVVLRFAASGDFTAEVTTDAAALLSRLEVLAGRPRSAPADAVAFADGIERLQAEFVRHVRLSFDGRPVAPRFEYRRDGLRPAALDPLSPPTAHIRLTGHVPAAGRLFAWRYDLTSASYGLTIATPGGGRSQWLEGGSESEPFDVGTLVAPPSRLSLAGEYFVLGFTHILPHGVDHILFVIGIFLFSRRLRPMLWQVSAFTVAHSISLGLTLFGVVSPSSALVEPLIALSIVYVAVENLAACDLTWRRLALVFAFGLLHGMGFAGALRDVGLPPSELVLGLVTFNAGVEAGQLTIIAAAFAICAGWLGHRASYRRLVVVPASVLIALTGLYWTIERLPVW